MSELKNVGINHNVNDIVRQWIKVYTIVNIQENNYEVDKARDDILRNIEDIVIPNLMSVNPNAQEELDEAVKKENTKLKLLMNNPNKAYTKNFFRIYDEESRINNKKIYYNEDQREIIALRFNFHRKKFRKLNELARQMFIANNKEIHNNE